MAMDPARERIRAAAERAARLRRESEAAAAWAKGACVHPARYDFQYKGYVGWKCPDCNAAEWQHIDRRRVGE